MKWEKEEILLLKNLRKNGETISKIAEKLNRTAGSVHQKATREGIYCNEPIKEIEKPYDNSWRFLTHEQYLLQIKEKPITVIDKYINNKTKIMHMCDNCQNTWRVSPHSIKVNNTGCPSCSISGFKQNKPAITYCIYFKKLRLYKVGVTGVSLQRRFAGFPAYEIIFYREFETGDEALKLETLWLKNLNIYLINTGELLNGNTETFRV